VETASRKAADLRKNLREILAQDRTVIEHLTIEDLDNLFMPVNYLGAAEEFVDRVIHATNVD
jgi:adenylosuccinate lyase